MLNNAPSSFINLRGIAGISPDKTQEEWLSIWEKSITDYLFELLNDGQLDEEELKELDSLLDKVINKDESINDKDVIKITVMLIKDEERRKQAITKFAQIFVKHYIGSCQELEKTMSLVQKQVVSAYSKVLDKSLIHNG
jgi:hypothetical protein